MSDNEFSVGDTAKLPGSPFVMIVVALEPEGGPSVMQYAPFYHGKVNVFWLGTHGQPFQDWLPAVALRKVAV